MNTGKSILAYLMKNLFIDVGFMGFINGVYQGLYSIYVEKQEEITSLLSSMVEEKQK